MEPSKPPRVFISYSWESEDHKRWVRYLGESLYKAGIEARLDQWFVQPGESFTAFMEQEVEAADFVLVVCTPSYASKSNKRQGGVGYEQQIVSGRLMSGTARSKFIPILRRGDYEPGPDCAIPTHFQGIAWIEFRDDVVFEESLDNLIRAIFSKPRFAPPPLGTRPSLETITTTVLNRSNLAEADERGELPDLNIEKGDNVKTASKEADEAAIEVNSESSSSKQRKTQQELDRQRTGEELHWKNEEEERRQRAEEKSNRKAEQEQHRREEVKKKPDGHERAGGSLLSAAALLEYEHGKPIETIGAAQAVTLKADAVSAPSGDSYKKSLLWMFEISKREWRNTLVWQGLTLSGLIISLFLARPVLDVVVDPLKETMGGDEHVVAVFLCAICGATIGFTQWIWLKKKADIGPAWILWSFIILGTIGVLTWELVPLAEFLLPGRPIYGPNATWAITWNTVYFRLFEICGLFFAVVTAALQGWVMKQSHVIVPSVVLQALPWFLAQAVPIMSHVPREESGVKIGLGVTILVWVLLNAVVMTAHMKAAREGGSDSSAL